MKGEQVCENKVVFLTMTWERLKAGCVVGWGNVVSSLSWLSRSERKGRPELSSVLPPSVSTGWSCLLHLAWLMNKPSPV